MVCAIVIEAPELRLLVVKAIIASQMLTGESVLQGGSTPVLPEIGRMQAVNGFAVIRAVQKEFLHCQYDGRILAGSGGWNGAGTRRRPAGLAVVAATGGEQLNAEIRSTHALRFIA
jgi:hypothetical protein